MKDLIRYLIFLLLEGAIFNFLQYELGLINYLFDEDDLGETHKEYTDWETEIYFTEHDYTKPFLWLPWRKDYLLIMLLHTFYIKKTIGNNYWSLSDTIVDLYISFVGMF